MTKKEEAAPSAGPSETGPKTPVAPVPVDDFLFSGEEGAPEAPVVPPVKKGEPRADMQEEQPEPGRETGEFWQRCEKFSWKTPGKYRFCKKRYGKTRRTAGCSTEAGSHGFPGRQNPGRSLNRRMNFPSRLSMKIQKPPSAGKLREVKRRYPTQPRG